LLGAPPWGAFARLGFASRVSPFRARRRPPPGNAALLRVGWFGEGGSESPPLGGRSDRPGRSFLPGATRRTRSGARSRQISIHQVITIRREMATD